MKTKAILIPEEQYVKDAVSALNDLVVLALKKEGLIQVESEVRVKFQNGKGFEHSNLVNIEVQKSKPKALKKRK